MLEEGNMYCDGIGGGGDQDISGVKRINLGAMFALAPGPETSPAYLLPPAQLVSHETWLRCAHMLLLLLHQDKEEEEEEKEEKEEKEEEEEEVEEEVEEEL